MSGAQGAGADEGGLGLPEFLDSFVAAFATLSGARVAAPYAVAFVGCHGEGRLARARIDGSRGVSRYRNARHLNQASSGTIKRL